jgi:hypothetical protein
MPGVVDFDGAGAGVCNIWHLAYDGDITGLAPGLNANDLEGCFSLSAPIQVTRTNAGDCQANGGDLFGGPFEFCVSDGEADMISADSITVANTNGETFQWVVTNDLGEILGLPGSFADVDFDDAGDGICLIWHLAYDGDIIGLEAGLNTADIEGCFSFSNSIEVVRDANCPGVGGDPMELRSVALYPVPATTQLSMDIDMSGESEVEVLILNATGQVEMQLGKYETGNSIDISTLVSGRYVVTITSGNQRITKAFVKF